MLLVQSGGRENVRGVRILRLPCNLFLTAIFVAVPHSPAAQPDRAFDPADIVHKSVAVNTSDWKAQPDYSYREQDTKSKIDSSGHTRIEQWKTYEVMMIEGTPYSRLVAIENEPLSRAQEQQEQKKLNTEIGRRQNESARDKQTRLAKYQGERSEEHMLMQQMISAFHFKFAGEEEIEGTPCYVLDALPNPDYRPPVERARVLMGMKGRLWIDKAGYHWVKVQAQVISPVQFGFFIAKVNPGTSFELNQAPVADVWLPKSFTETVNATVLGFYGMRTREEQQFSAYHQTLLTAQR